VSGVIVIATLALLVLAERLGGLNRQIENH
jgi:hypothetical protein